MGAGLAELFLGRDRSGGQAFPDPGDGLQPSGLDQPETKAPDAAGSVKCGNQARPGSQADARSVPLSVACRTTPCVVAYTSGFHAFRVELPLLGGFHHLIPGDFGAFIDGGAAEDRGEIAADAGCE